VHINCVYACVLHGAPDVCACAPPTAAHAQSCFWSTSCHGTNYPSSAAAEYYRSVASLLNEWQVGYVKADCFFPNMPASQPQPVGYFDEDVIGFGEAMKAAGVSVSFSPGAGLGCLRACMLPSPADGRHSPCAMQASA
jgi:hypothetical protein